MHSNIWVRSQIQLGWIELTSQSNPYSQINKITVNRKFNLIQMDWPRQLFTFVKNQIYLSITDDQF
jgi:hypothetical protein